MLERTLRVLEFNKIRDILVSQAVSEMGKLKCSELVPSSYISQVRNMLDQTEEACVYLTRLGYNPVPAFDDVRNQIKKAQIGSTLSARDLLLIAGALRASRSVKQALVKHDEPEEERTSLSKMCDALVTMRELEDDISSAIISEDEIADNASSELASIRRQIRIANDRIREKLNSYLHSSQMQRYLQENVITVRNGRYVLPVKQEYRQQVNGLIHDQSSTGATVFIEPMAIVELGNDIKALNAKEYAEIERILAEFSARIEPIAGQLLENLDILAHMDFVFAKARLSRMFNCCLPKINDNGYINIKRGRHPLLDPKTVVPSNLWLGKDFTTLVITGPNTGGKTVTLKTAGLFCLMAQSGLHVPADIGTEVAVFKEIFADIGDEQSIEQSLSTFSSHMTNIVSILDSVDEKSMVLFDELGAGTDPTEGASLAQAILDTLLKRGIITMATTHYSELKAYAMTTPGVQNASVEFNVETLRPTYKLSIGIPGKSNAFEISKRLGLSDAIIEQAKEKLSTDQIRFEDVISNAEYHRQVAQKEREIAEEARKEIVELQEQIEKQRKQIENQRQEMLKKAREEARRIVYSAKDEAERVITQLKKTAAEQATITKETMNARQALEKTLDRNLEPIQKSELEKLSTPPKSVNVGETVMLVKMGVEATVLSKPNDKGEFQVQAGIMKLNVKLKDVRKTAQKQQQSGSVRKNIDMSQKYVPMELDVRGMLVDEAIEAVDKYIDDAYLSTRKEVSVIHGKGTGALRAGLQDFLKSNPRVASFRGGKIGDGDAGVTVIQLK